MASSVGRQTDTLTPVPVSTSVPAPAAVATPPKALANVSVRAALAAWRELQGRSVSIVAACVAVVIGLGAYYAGVQSASLQVAQLNSQLQRAEKEAPVTDPVALPPVYAAHRPAPVTAPPAGPVSSRDADQLRENLRTIQAQNDEYRTLLDLRDAEQTAGRSLLTALGVGHATLHPMKAANPAMPLVAYLVTAPGGRLVFVASVLPPVEPGHQYQLWFYRKDDPSALRGPVFDLKQPVAIDLNQVLPAAVDSIEITIEPTGGSEVPSTQAIATSTIEE